MRNLLVFFTMVFLAMVPFWNAEAQPNSHWKKVLSSNKIGKQPTPYFLNASLGFVYSPFLSEVLRTTDSGNTWRNISPIFSGANQVYFCTPAHGFLASKKGLFETNDTGSSWIVIDTNMFVSVYANEKKVFAVQENDSATGISSFISTYRLLSRELSLKTFDTVFSGQRTDWGLVLSGKVVTQVLGNKDSAIIASDNQILWYSTNNGNQWDSVKVDDQVIQNGSIEGIYCFPHCTDITLTFLPYLDNDEYPLIHSTDFGKTWNTLYNDQIGAWIAGTRCHLFVSFAGEPVDSIPKGLFRSDDGGNTWKFMKGPDFTEIDDLDFHNLSIVGHGAIVYASDFRYYDSVEYFDSSKGFLMTYDSSNLWVSYDGGDGTLSPNPTLIRITSHGHSIPNVLTISACESISLPIVLENICDYIKLEHLAVEGLDSSEYLVANSESYQCGDYRGNFTIQITPHIFKDRKFALHFTYSDDEFNRYDTTIPIDLHIKPTPAVLLPSQSEYEFDTLSACGQIQDSTVVLVNYGCDTVRVSSLILNGAGFDTISPVGLPWIILPKDSIRITFRFRPDVPKSFRCIVTITTEQEGLEENIILTLTGTGKQQGRGVLSYSPRQFNFQSLSICAHDSALGYVTNVGCDSIQLDPAALFGDPDYKLTANSSSLTVKPRDTLMYQVYVNPAQKGLRQGYLIFTSLGKGNTLHDTVHFTVTVTDGTVILSSSLAAADFGSIPVCDQKDTLVTLFNSGCDTMFVTGYNVSGLGFGSDTKFPIRIPPGKSSDFHLFTLLDTTGGKTFTTGTLTFQSNANDTLPPIILNRTFIGAAHRDLGLYLEAIPKTGSDLSTATYDIKESPGKTFTGAGIKNITFDLNYNTDLLEFNQTKSINVSSADGKSFTMTGSPEIQADQNGTLATIGFTVYLIKDSVTTIDLSSAKIDTTSLPCTTTTFSYSGSTTFSYNFFCGERSIAGFLNGKMPLRIVTLRPNPTQDELDLDLQSTTAQDVTILIFDVLGTKVFSDVRNIEAGSNSIHLDTKGLSGGMYMVSIGSSSQSFVKMR